MSIFPNELIENILEHVYGSYLSPNLPLDLYRCARVCHTWHAISESLIFSQLRIDLKDKRMRALEPNPHLRQYVRQVWVGDLSAESELLAQSVLYPLPNVQELYMLEDCPDPSLVLDPSTSGALLRNLTSLGLWEIHDFPAKYFYHCSSLRHLKIVHCTFDLDCSPTSSASDAPRPQLHSIHVSGFRESHIEIFAWMSSSASAFDLTALTSFRAEDQTNGDGPYEWIRGIIQLCGPTLQSLMLDPPTTLLATRDPKITSEALPYPSTLFNLRVFTVTMIQEIDDYTDYIPWLNAIFCSLPINNRLEEICFQCTLPDLPKDNKKIADHMNLFGWKNLDDTLNSSHLNLKRVVLDVLDVSGHGAGRVDELQDLLRNCNLFPGLEKKGVFEVVDRYLRSPSESQDGQIDGHWWRL